MNDSNARFSLAVKMTFLVAASSLGCAILGGLFGILVAAVGGDSLGRPIRVGGSLGLVVGGFLGAAVACLACILVTVLKSVRSGKSSES